MPTVRPGDGVRRSAGIAAGERSLRRRLDSYDLLLPNLVKTAIQPKRLQVPSFGELLLLEDVDDDGDRRDGSPVLGPVGRGLPLRPALSLLVLPDLAALADLGPVAVQEVNDGRPVLVG